MANYHNPKTGKTVQAKNRAEAIKKMVEKPKPAVTTKKATKEKKEDK